MSISALVRSQEKAGYFHPASAPFNQAVTVLISVIFTAMFLSTGVLLQLLG